MAWKFMARYHALHRPLMVTVAFAVPAIADADVHQLSGSIFVIVMENTNWSDIKGNPSAAYINRLLVHPQASYASNYNNPPGLHPSEPNYIWMEAGDNFGIANDGDPTRPANQLKGKDHFTRQLDKKGISWASYQEDISGADCPLSTQQHYAPKHNPFVFFDDVTDNFSPDSPSCIRHIRPFAELGPALSAPNLPKYIFITPNQCNDMHDTCLPLRDRIKQGDQWLEHVVPALMASTGYQRNGAIIITWDEGVPGDGPIGMIVLSPRAKGNGYTNTIYYTHGSLLRTLEENLDLPLLGDANRQKNLEDLLQ